MGVPARYAHTNIIARDWRRLVRFYADVFGCRPIEPQRELGGDWLEAATGVPGARLEGQHLLLPGHGPSGPTLEIYSCAENVAGEVPVANRVGYGHVAFEVADVEAALAEVLAHGGQRWGTVSRASVAGAGELEVVYARDPEGNVLELQSWRR